MKDCCGDFVWRVSELYHGFGVDGAMRYQDGKTVVIEDVILRDVDPMELTALPNHPAIHLTPTSAQDLMDNLWRAGVRPTRKGDPSGHLEDMRKLVAAAYEVDL